MDWACHVHSDCPKRRSRSGEGSMHDSRRTNKDYKRMKVLKQLWQRLRTEVQGSIFVEYLLLLTLVGIGVIAGLAAVRLALINELKDLADAINAIT
jgi:pilus assembly protein Flp/PilA